MDEVDVEKCEKIEQIKRIVCAKCSNLIHIHLYGVASSNRDSILNEVVEQLEQNEEAIFIHINSVLLEGSSRVFCDEIISHLPHSNKTSKANSLQQLFDYIEQLLEINTTNQIIVFVFGYAEALLRFTPTYLSALFATPKKYGGMVKLITVSTLPWSNFEAVQQLSTPIQFSFSAFTKDQLLRILCRRVSYGENFVRLILDTVYQVCRDVKQLEYLMESFWKQNDQLCQTIFSSQSDISSDSYKKLQPLLRKCSENLFYRFQTQSLFNNNKFDDKSFDLPLSTKFLLIASYCASYNPVPSDRRFFTKNHGKQRRKSTDLNRDRSDCAHQCGPKSFDLQRLLFIYLSLLEMYNVRTGISSNIHTQVCELCTKGYLAKASADANLDLPKYKCIASFEMISPLATSLSIKLTDYLFDFTI